MLATGKRRPCCYAIVPLDLHKALAATPAAKTRWSGLTSNERRDLIDWVNAAEQREARARRVDDACAMLAAGRRGVSGSSAAPRAAAARARARR